MTFFDSDALLNQALSFHREGKLDQAEQIYELILQEMPLVSCVYSFLGCIKREKKKYNEAIALFRQAIRLVFLLDWARNAQGVFGMSKSFSSVHMLWLFVV